MRLNFEVTGKQDGPAILLVHGFLSSNAQWLPNIDELGREHQLVMAELWGHGDSPIPDKEAFTLQRYDDEFEQIRHELNIEKWSVIGQSYAAGLAIRYGINHPAQTSRIVVTNSRSAFGDITTQQRPPPKTTEGKTTEVDTSRNRHMPIHPIYARRLPEDVKAKLVEAADNMTEEAISKGGRIGLKLNAMEILDQIAVPILLTNGVYEKSFQADAATIRGKFPNVNVVDLPGGHAVNIEASVEFNNAVLDFIKQ